VVVLERIPFRLACDLFSCGDRHHDLVFICNSREPIAIPIPHLVQAPVDVHLPLVFNRLDKAFSVRRVADTLEELNAFLALKLLELPVLFYELLLVGA